MNIKAELENRISAVISEVAGKPDCPAIIAVAGNPKFGDYQANGAMAAAKIAKTNPRQLATEVLEKLDISDIASKVEIAGPGFINITLTDGLLVKNLEKMDASDTCGIEKTLNGDKVVVDYSGPNLAKEMHVGHLRSTIIGDCIARVLEFMGADVIRQNHVGDWGTQFGMLIAYFYEQSQTGDTSEMNIADMEEFYRQAKKRFDADENFADSARDYVVKLQSGDEKVYQAWCEIVRQSLNHCRDIYKTLNVSLGDDNVRGESFYNDDLPEVLSELESKGMLSESQGAKCVFLDGDQFKGPDGEAVPVIVRKSDGGYLYATTDLAAMRYRANTLGADRIIYVTDSRQGYHFSQVFAVARAAGFVDDKTSLEHITFGMMLDSKGHPLKTREGGTVKLSALLSEAVSLATELVAEKNSDLPADQIDEISRTVGIGAVKYADLSMDRGSDYKFSWEKMLALQGNTAPYMQYAYARVKSIFRKASEGSGDISFAGGFTEEAERNLALRLVRFGEALDSLAGECRPNILTSYLYELAGAFSSFYESCPVLKSEGTSRSLRMGLCKLTADVIACGLGLLGIDVIEQM